MKQNSEKQAGKFSNLQKIFLLSYYFTTKGGRWHKFCLCSNQQPFNWAQAIRWFFSELVRGECCGMFYQQMMLNQLS